MKASDKVDLILSYKWLRGEGMSKALGESLGMTDLIGSFVYTKTDVADLCKMVEAGDVKKMQSELQPLSIEDRKSLVNTPLDCQIPVLHAVVSSSTKKMVSLFLKEGAEINAMSEATGHVLHMALTRMFKDPDMNSELLMMLLDNGADINASSKGFLPPLAIAVEYEVPDQLIEMMMLRSHHELNQDTLDAAFGMAAHYARLSTMKLFFDRGANPCVENPFGYNSFDYDHPCHGMFKQKEEEVIALRDKLQDLNIIDIVDLDELELPSLFEDMSDPIIYGNKYNSEYVGTKIREIRNIVEDKKSSEIGQVFWDMDTLKEIQNKFKLIVEAEKVYFHASYNPDLWGFVNSHEKYFLNGYDEKDQFFKLDPQQRMARLKEKFKFKSDLWQVREEYVLKLASPNLGGMEFFDPNEVSLGGDDMYNDSY